MCSEISNRALFHISWQYQKLGNVRIRRNRKLEITATVLRKHLIQAEHHKQLHVLHTSASVTQAPSSHFRDKKVTLTPVISSKVTQVVTDKVRIRTQVSLTPKPILLLLLPHVNYSTANTWSGIVPQLIRVRKAFKNTAFRNDE